MSNKGDGCLAFSCFGCAIVCLWTFWVSAFSLYGFQQYSSVARLQVHLTCTTVNIVTRMYRKRHPILFYCITPTGCIRKKVAPLKLFWNIFTSVKSFCVKFCVFVGNSYPHISTNFCRFIFIKWH